MMTTIVARITIKDFTQEIDVQKLPQSNENGKIGLQRLYTRD